MKNRKLFTGAALVAVLATLGVVQGYLDKVAAQAKQVPRFEVDPFWPKPMPNNYVFGQTIGLGISSDDHVWIIHRGNDPGNLDRTEIAVADSEGAPRGQRVLQPGAAGAWNSMRPATTSAAGAARSRARRIRGPRATTASSSITRASCGSAATAGRLAHPEVHARRQVRGAVRQAGRAQGSGVARRQAGLPCRTASTWTTSAASPRSSSIRRPTKATSPTAT